MMPPANMHIHKYNSNGAQERLEIDCQVEARRELDHSESVCRLAVAKHELLAEKEKARRDPQHKTDMS